MRELDRKVAEALGYRVEYIDDLRCYKLLEPDGRPLAGCWPGPESAEFAHDKLWEMVTPHFSADMNTAWTLVELCYSGSVTRIFDGNEYESYLVIERNGTNADGFARAETAPEAICKAFLALATD